MGPQPTSIVSITTPEEARALGEHLLNRKRTRPVCVVSVADQATTPFIDVGEVARELGEVCEYYLVPTGRLTFALTDLLPEAAGVYGGAGRIYGPADEWTANPFTGCPLVMCREVARGPAATDQLIQQGLRFGGSSTSTVAPTSRHSTFTVKQIYPPSRALAVDADGQFASLWAESLLPGVDIDSLVVPGQRIEGRVVLGAGRIAPADLPRPSAQALREYAVGSVVLVRVAEVLVDRASVELVPGLRAVLHRDDVTGNPIDRMTSLVSEGEVLGARVLRIGVPGGKGWRLGTLDVDDDEPLVTAPALLPGGPPWLRSEQIGVVARVEAAPPSAPTAPVAVPKPAPPPGVPVARPVAPKPAPKPGPPGVVQALAPQPVPVPVHKPAPTPPRPVLPPDDSPLLLRLSEAEKVIGDLQLTVERLRVEQARLRNTLRDLAGQPPRPGQAEALAAAEEAEALRQQRSDLEGTARSQEAEIDRLREEAASQRLELRRAKQDAQRAKRAQRESGEAPTVWSDPERQFRWEVEQAWAVRIPAAEKPSLPLREYVVLPGFLDSLAETAGIDRSKVVDVVVDIATGRVHDIPARETHQLRSGDGGAPARTREDGATCWRVALQINTPSARRLHFWQPPGRPPELSSVRLHDDFQP
ncbi:hypothetical protein FNH13_07280 [Ornithinimicrobium ciconiae]|uniref:S1 motif domain-containing protein n=1 Tax=Ornithinimicrobium ciconiae TaxID=2594265 RepID=A0A516G9G0_9MICO|nr:hypothetical protein [Ornithinimicrobium ciconiae]QDO88169.1 hypothetical protein FNH13_07280 [Ornithinimicrobium ciconiae]